MMIMRRDERLNNDNDNNSNVNGVAYCLRLNGLLKRPFLAAATLTVARFSVLHLHVLCCADSLLKDASDDRSLPAPDVVISIG